MGNLVKRGLLAALGVAVTLAWWTLRGGGTGTPAQEGIPSRVWNGGGGTLAIQVETTCPAKMSIGFEERGKDEGAKSLETWEHVAAGTRSWTVDVPPSAGGYIELDAENPKVGDQLKWAVSVNGQVIDEQSETLQEALKPGYAFFPQIHLEDYGEAKPDEEG
jgi:hypothetical protein